MECIAVIHILEMRNFALLLALVGDHGGNSALATRRTNFSLVVENVDIVHKNLIPQTS